MSKHSHTQCRVMHDIETMSRNELEEQYDIVTEEDGSVWDNFEGRSFDNLQQWGLFILSLEEDDEEDFVKIGGKHRFDDDR